MVNKKAAFLLTMLLVVPFVASENSTSMTLTPDEQYVAYPGQTVQHHLDVTFAGTSGTTLKLDLQSQYLSEMTGNGQELVFDDGETNRFLWTLTLPSSTPYGYDTINATIIDTSDQSTQSVDVELKITAPSNINFGNTQSSAFVVDPSIRTNVATNITSNATLTDEITFTIQTDSSWNWGWTMDDVDGTNARLQLGPNTMDFVRIWVDVPDVIDGAPLANQGPTFRLVGTSGLDGAKIAWDFSLDVSSFRNVTIDSVQTDVVVDPAGNTRVDVSVRNTGNIPDTISITLGNVVINGDAVAEQDADRITSNGWTVALFNALEDVLLMPNESRIIEVGVQAPGETSGTISVDIIIQPTNFPFRSVRESATVNISWDRSFSHNLEPVDCTYLQPSTSCSASINLQNIGNFVDSVVIDDVTSPDFVTGITFRENPLVVERYSEVEFQAIEFRITDNATAYQQGTVEFDLRMNEGDILQRYSIDVIVGPNVAWTFIDGQSEVDSRDVVSFAVQLRNDGNLEDGLIVQLQSSHSTVMGFAPPEGAIIEGDSEQPRVFELGNLPRGANFTLRGSAELPSEQTVNGTLVLDIVVRSIFDPETEFVYSIEEQYLGKQWNSAQESNGYSISEFFEDVTLIIKGWWLIVASVAVSAVILNKAVRDRMQRKESEKLLAQMRKEPDETQEDWMEKFNRSSKQDNTVIESPAMTQEAFTKAFQSQSKPSAPALEPLPEPVRAAATTVLDHHDMVAQRATMDQIAQDIVSHGPATPHIENANLTPTNSITERTVRHENPDLKPKMRMGEAVPLPSKVDTDEEFDL